MFLAPLLPWARALRVHQWLKNLLLFVPLVAAHQLTDANAWFVLMLALLSFSLCASSVYISNDLLDLASDRLHPRKQQRPFACGQIPIWAGLVLAPLLLLISLGLGVCVNNGFLTWLLFYFLVSCVYSLALKRLILVDCLALAILYTMRIIAGAAAVSIMLSFWLLAFSVFLFLSLAFVKRYSELKVQHTHSEDKLHGRGYYVSDAPLIQTFGVSSGYASVVVLAFYLNSNAVLTLYKTPECIWGAVPILLFWISWMWMQAHRGKMHDDPLLFAIRDRASLFAGSVFVGVMGLGTLGFPW
ncbi:MAG: UbiA family prenyltransferase [Legionellales bacterium]